MKLNQEVIVKAEKIAHGGFVVARYEEKVLFVRKALPDELVKVRILKKAPGGRAWIAEAIEVIEPSQFRVEPECIYFKEADCGGCDFQHAQIDYQRELKINVLVEQMQRLANLSVTHLIKAHQLEPKDYQWRSKIRLAPNYDGKLGYRKYRSHEIVPIADCQIATPEINDLLNELKDQKFSDEQILIARDGQAQVVSAKSSKKVTTNILGFDFIHVDTGFWQPHIRAAESLSNLLLSKVITAESTLDLYAGVGIFGRLLLEKHKTQKLVSVELDAAASNCAKENLQKFPKASVVSQRAEVYLKETPEEFDLVILDPPRKGLGIVATKYLAKAAKEQIIYLSCDPASLARDTKELTKNGWHLSQLDLIDAFPQTHHLETLAVFSRNN